MTVVLLPAIARISHMLAVINGKAAAVPRNVHSLWGILQLSILVHANGITRLNVRYSLRCLPTD